MLRIFFGIALIVAGAAMTIKFEKAFQLFGRVAWAEKHLGTGESRLFYQLLGALLAFIGMAITFNLHTQIFLALFGPLFGL